MRGKSLFVKDLLIKYFVFLEIFLLIADLQLKLKVKIQFELMLIILKKFI